MNLLILPSSVIFYKWGVTLQLVYLFRVAAGTAENKTTLWSDYPRQMSSSVGSVAKDIIMRQEFLLHGRNEETLKSTLELTSCYPVDGSAGEEIVLWSLLNYLWATVAVDVSALGSSSLLIILV